VPIQELLDGVGPLVDGTRGQPPRRGEGAEKGGGTGASGYGHGSFAAIGASACVGVVCLLRVLWSMRNCERVGLDSGRVCAWTSNWVGELCRGGHLMGGWCWIHPNGPMEQD
jgi:hypothetical protein